MRSNNTSFVSFYQIAGAIELEDYRDKLEYLARQC